PARPACRCRARATARRGRSRPGSRARRRAPPARSGPGPRASSRGAPPSAERAPVLALVVLAVLARADRPPPPLVLAVPLDGPAQALLEEHLRRPAERLGPLGGQRVAAVVSE